MDSEIKEHFDGLRTEIRVVALKTDGLQTEIRAVAQETEGLRNEIRSVADRGAEIKRSLGVLSESLRTDIRTVAEGLIGTNERLDRFESQVYEKFGDLTAMLRLSFAELDRRLASR
jgi:predicted  nucleic acid-binding Zn-ribbon protein